MIFRKKLKNFHFWPFYYKNSMKLRINQFSKVTTLDGQNCDFEGSLKSTLLTFVELWAIHLWDLDEISLMRHSKVILDKSRLFSGPLEIAKIGFFGFSSKWDPIGFPYKMVKIGSKILFSQNVIWVTTRGILGQRTRFWQSKIDLKLFCGLYHWSIIFKILYL